MNLEFEKRNFNKLVFSSLIILVLMQFLQDISFIYYLVLFFFYSMTFLIFINQPKLISLNTLVSFFYLLVLLSFSVIVVESFFYIIEDHSIIEIANGSIRLFLMPTFAFILFTLIRDTRDFILIKNIFIIFIILAAVSIMYQVVFGKLSFVANPYGALRFGLPGYASITGAVNTYPGAFYSAAVLLFFSNYRNDFIKGLLILFVCGASIFTMSKSGILNTIIIFLIFSFAGIFFKKFKLLIYLYLISFVLLLFSSQILNATVITIVNTFGIELIGMTKSSATEWQDITARISDRIFGFFLSKDMPSINEFLFGVGLRGGSGTTGFYSPTTHNAFLDIYVMGGVIAFFAIIGLYISVQITLIKSYYENKDSFIIAMFISNLLIFINGLVHNGALLHPAMSFMFWVSVSYLFIYTKKNSY